MTDVEIAREVERQIAVMREGTVDFYGEEDLKARLATALREDRPLRVKLGLDPSSPSLHLGHTVVLGKLRRFQDLGHTPIFLVGDFTARIGDPSGKKKTRPALSAQEVAENAKTYVAQASRMLDVERAEVRFNSEWMDALKPADFVRLCSHSTVARLLERDDFAKRYAAGDPIAVHEFLYPFAQSYDSVALEADVELGGTDQTFNLLMGREIQRDYAQAPQAVLTLPLLVGTDGVEKMSKSLGNAIGVTDSAEDIYGRVMSISDALMLDYATTLDMGDWDDLLVAAKGLAAGEGDPMAFKQRLASCLADRFHGDGAGERGAAHFRRVVQEKSAPSDVPSVEVAAGSEGAGLLDTLVSAGLAASNSEARRLVAQGAVAIDGEKVGDPKFRILAGGPYLIKVGKRRYAEVIATQ